MCGWVKLYRSLLDEEWYGNVNDRLVFLHCLLRANYKALEWKGETVPRGSFVTTIRSLAEEVGIPVRTLRVSLARLSGAHKLAHKLTHKDAHKLLVETRTKWTFITITDYDSYQGIEQQARTNFSEERAQTHAQSDAQTHAQSKEDIRISTTTAPARVCAHEGDGDGIDADIRELRGSQVWLEQIMMKHRILPGELDGLFSDFASECRCNGLKAHIDLNDAKRHFNAWLRIIKEKEDGKTNWRDSERNVRDAQREAILRTMQVVAGTAEVDRDVQKPF